MSSDEVAETDKLTVKVPRSLTLTFAETHPWEMLVRDRLSALPRGYLKRFVLALIENSRFDLENEALFTQQVERLLLKKNFSVQFDTSHTEIAERVVKERETQPIEKPAARKISLSHDQGFGALEL